MGFPDYFDLREMVDVYYQELKDIKPKKESLTEQVVQLTKEKTVFEDMATRYDALLEIMTDWRMGASGDSSAEARVYIDKEITQYVAILSED